MCKACCSIYNKGRPTITPAAHRRYNLKKLYNIAPEEYDEMLSAQGGVCAACGTDEPGGKHNNFHVDHCHDTGRVRALLCVTCNITLGRYGESAERLSGLLRYCIEQCAIEHEEKAA